MRIDAATAADLRFVAENMRESDEREFLALNKTDSRADLVAALIQRFAGEKLIAAKDDTFRPIAIGDVVENRPNVGTLLFFATNRFPEIARPLTRFIRQRLFPIYRQNGLHRIECWAAGDRPDVHRWLGALGLEHEATVYGFGKGGETYEQFAWVADDVRAAGARH